MPDENPNSCNFCLLPRIATIYYDPEFWETGVDSVLDVCPIHLLEAATKTIGMTLMAAFEPEENST